MRRPAIPAQNRNTLEFALHSSATFGTGASVHLDGSQLIVEGGTNPAAIRGFAAHKAGDREVEPGRVLVHVAHETATFWMDGNVAPVAADVGKEYGLTADSDGVWHVDKTKTSTIARVHVHRIDLERGLYEVSVLEDNRQTGP